ncbi:hypothetical protein L3X38_011882 [Prunus dulcis]|uniref:Uncharacterized protein n=1 Tax=Prunus dulcis TaxID=3755 RepID=A0AAD4ZFG9_PRUDU|nr:hypothetical protein L3X38_011882 [Prunus dulcis]
MSDVQKPISHGAAMSFTRDAVLFKSRVHGPNSEVGAQICGLPDLSLHARRSSSSSIASAICPTSPRGARLQLIRPHSRLELAVWQACAWHKVGVAMIRPDSPCHSISRGGVLDSQPMVIWHCSIVAYIHLGVIS